MSEQCCSHLELYVTTTTVSSLRIEIVDALLLISKEEQELSGSRAVMGRRDWKALGPRRLATVEASEAR